MYTRQEYIGYIIRSVRRGKAFTKFTLLIFALSAMASDRSLMISLLLEAVGLLEKVRVLLAKIVSHTKVIHGCESATKCSK